MKKRAQSKKPAKSRAAKSVAAKSRSKKKTTPARSSRGDKTKAIVRRWFEELWNRNNPAVLNELLAPNAVGETEGGRITGHGEFISKLHSPLIGAFPDIRVTLDDIIADGDSAAVRWTFEGTHRGDTLGLPATNRRVKVSGMSWVRCKNGQLVAGWDRWNSAGLMSYLKDGAVCATVCAPADSERV